MKTIARPSLPASRDPVAVLGIGRSGRAAARLLAARGMKPVVFDTGSGTAVAKAAGELAGEGIECVTGPRASAPDRNFSFTVLSPGIVPESPMARAFENSGAPLFSEIEFAWRLSASPVVAITGSNGKTTTTSLLSHLLRKAGKNAPACGNIGDAFSDAVRTQPGADAFVLEISSFQLETCFSFRPEVAVWTNFSPNHLDRYPSLEEYRAAKLRIFRNQTSRDFAVVRAGDAAGGTVPATSARWVSFSAEPGAVADYTFADGWITARGERILELAGTPLRGPHNAENLMAALAAGECLGLPPALLAKGAADFALPEHRCEPVLERDGILWINDSKSTTIDALEKALSAQDRPVVLIAGGKDKGFRYDSAAHVVKKHVTFVVLIGQMKSKIAEDWSGVSSAPAASLEEAVALAARAAGPGAVVLFSPGTSSFDMFEDYEDRGRQFKKAVLDLHKLS